MPKDWTKDSRCKYAYLFKEGSGSTVTDSSGNGNTGTFKSSTEPGWNTTFPNYGKYGRASGSALWDNSNDYIDAGTADIITENGAFSFVGWAFQLGVGVNSRLFQRGSLFFYSDQGADSKAVIIQINGTGSNLAHVSNNALVSYNTWQHWAVTGDGSNTAANYKIYLNSVEVGYATTTNGTLPTDNSGMSLVIGNANTFDRCYNGNLTDIGFFNSVLALAEIQDIYNYGLSAGGGIMTPNTGFWGGV